MEIAVSESQPPHGDRQLVSCPDLDSDWEPYSCKQQPFLDGDTDEEINLVLVSEKCLSNNYFSLNWDPNLVGKKGLVLGIGD